VNKALINTLKKQHPNVDIVMASKYLTTKNDFEAAIEAGVDTFGESRVEALLEKLSFIEALPVSMHFIGTLQTKKVKKVIDHIECLHALDRLKLAREIDKRRKSPLACFIQVNISHETQKHGVHPDEVSAFLRSLAPLNNIRVIGLMGMAAAHVDASTIRKQFMTLKTLQEKLSKTYPNIKALSMGMSEDYHIALECGATVLRLGRVLLGEGSYGTHE